MFCTGYGNAESDDAAFGVSMSWGAGAYLAFITAIVAAAAAIAARLPQNVSSQRRMPTWS